MNTRSAHDLGKRGMRALAVFCLCVWLGTAGFAQAQGNGIAAKVNGVEISIFRLERHFEDYLKSRGRNPVAIRSPEVFKRFKREALDQLIEKELLWQEAQRLGVHVEPQAVEKARNAVESGFTTQDAFMRRIRDAGFDDASYSAYLEKEIAAGLVLQTLLKDVDVPESDVRAAYEANRSAFERPERVRARHILLRSSSEGDEADAVVKGKIEGVLKELRGGRDFAELAQEHSADPSATSGGDLGFFESGVMVPPFEQAAFSLRPGEISDPVKTPFGWHIIKVEERQAAGAVPEQEALEMVRQRLLSGRRSEAARDALEKLRAGAEIERLVGL